jgi:hypothetical protein
MAASGRSRSGGDAEEALSGNLSAFADAAADNIEAVKQKAMRTAQQEKAAGAEKINEIAPATVSNPSCSSRSIHEAAAALEHASTVLRERSVEDLGAEIGKFARAQPAAFFGAAILAGFAVARFLKSRPPLRTRREIAMRDTRTVPEILIDLLSEFGTLVRTEADLARSETSESGALGLMVAGRCC